MLACNEYPLPNHEANIGKELLQCGGTRLEAGAPRKRQAASVTLLPRELPTAPASLCAAVSAASSSSRPARRSAGDANHPRPPPAGVPARRCHCPSLIPLLA